MSSRRGSALLVVLGMVAFMVISAVAFSAYMRYSRLPSSYLRRSSSSRLLVKAALAEAIDQIDAAIGENVHPNVGMRSPRPGVGGVSADNNGVQNESLDNRNVWAHRVYLGTNNVNNLVSPDDTVSTLTLEGLAHIPPPLVNYARYYSRRSQAGRWRSLGYDAGRYAFCAIDVSDFFDVNALAANAGRSSAGNGRISIAHLFENAAHTGYEANPSDWDGSTFMQNFRSESPIAAALKGLSAAADTVVPLVSVADFNLALHAKAPGLFTSPFCQYVENNKQSFYGGLDGSTAEGARIRGMTFVTDAYYPSAGGTGADDDYDLADPQNQPWTGNDVLHGGLPTLGAVMNNLTDAGKRIRNRIGGLGMAELCDYLDENNVPVSLSIPQVERTPMIAGFEPNLEAKLQIVTTTEPSEAQSEAGLLSDNYPAEWGGTTPGNDVKTRTIRYRKIYTLDPMEFSKAFMGTVKTLVVYPFRRGSDALNPDTFTLDGHLSVFLTTGDFRFRTGNGNDSNLLRMMQVEGGLGVKDQLPANGIFHAQLPMTSLALPDVNNSEESHAVRLATDLTAGTDAAQKVHDAVKDNPILTVTWQQNQTATIIENQDGSKTKTWSNSGEPTIAEAVCGIAPMTGAGKPDNMFASNLLKQWIATESRPVTVRAAVWLRVRNGDSQTVDLVPACLNDDKEFLVVDNNLSMGPAGSDDLGSAYPVMFFTGGSFNFSLDASLEDSLVKLASTPKDLTFTARGDCKGVMCVDPRWNWAPEHWYAVENMTELDWLNAVKTFRSASGEAGGCDQDVFMATSDAGYLQSIYELAFLPRTTDIIDKLSDHGYGDYSMGTVRTPDDNRTEWALKCENKTGYDKDNVMNAGHMWRTYCPYDRLGCPRDEFEVNGDPWFVSEGGGCKVNPYSDNLDVLMAAFANTPFDWWAASTNWQAEAGITKEIRLDARQQFNLKYAFNGMNSNAKLAWNDLQQIALKFLEKIHGGEAAQQAAFGRPGLTFQSSGESGLRFEKETDIDIWKDKWDELDWGAESGDLCGVTFGDSDPLFDVDRKFLYGYWRDCFAPRQQLFLIFARAEPMMMGGGGSTPPQLGARVVALVWRDPTTTGENSKPHRTRVLFYRQLD